MRGRVVRAHDDRQLHRLGDVLLETQMDDVRAVLDAVASERAALFGTGHGGLMCSVFAATYPERTSALILYDPFDNRRS